MIVPMVKYSDMSLAAPFLSIVVPAYNESQGIEAFHQTLLQPVLDHLEKRLKEQYPDHQPYEVIYVNDGSSDDTLTKLQALAEGHPSLKVLNLSRNFGKEIATTAGIEFARGRASLSWTLMASTRPPASLTSWTAGRPVPRWL